MSEKSKKEAGRKAAKPRGGVAAAARNAARGVKKTPVFDDVSPQKKLREALRSLLPRVFADGRLDIDALCESLGESRESVARERYRFEWVGRADSVRLLEQNPALALRPCRGESVDFEATRNLYLEGDNLSVLRLLNRAYAGRVKMIYIDPPYNTGNDFVYNDKFGESFAAYEARAGEAESADAREESKRNGANRHSFWLSMMFPRLLLARDLLRDDGVIFVSIDDNEVHHLRLLLNAVFGEENFAADIIWNSTKSMTNTALISVGHTHNLCYFKDADYYVENRASFRLPETGEGFSNPDNDSRGSWKADPFQVGGWRPNQQYEIVNPTTGEKYTPKPGNSWKNDREKFEFLLADNRIVFGVSGEAGPQRKRFLSEAIARKRVAGTLWTDVGTTTNATRDMTSMFGKRVFDNPKPTGLIKRMLQLGAREKDAIVLDFFSGSATTAHAVMELNAEDGGKRQCVSVQLPEATDEESETRKAGFATIADLGKERLRRAGQKIRESLNGDAETDIGFRVFKIAPAVLRRRVSEEKATRQKRLDTESAEAQLYEVALAEGLSLTAQIEERKIGKNTVHQISDALNGRRLHICLDSKIAVDFPRKTIAEKGETVICRDDAMSDEIALNLSFHYNLKVL